MARQRIERVYKLIRYTDFGFPVRSNISFSFFKFLVIIIFLCSFFDFVKSISIPFIYLFICFRRDVYKTWTGVHGPPLIFEKEIASVNIKIYWRSGYEKHRLVFIAPHKWEDHKLVLRYRRSCAFLLPIFSFQHFQIAI